MVAVSIGENGVEFGPLADVKVHPAAELFPLLEGKDFEDLVEDIREHGLREPIVFTPDGQLLDGRNRYRACKKINNEGPRTRVEHDEPWAYVISTNMRRRHLTDNQRRMIGARIAERTKGEYQRANPSSGGFAQPPSQAEAARLLNVSRKGIERARQVVTHGTKALQQAVDENKVTVTTAARVASEMNAEEQDEFARKVRNGADPRRLAPPDTEELRRSSSSKSSVSPVKHDGRISTYYTRSEVLSKDSLIKLASTLSGLATGLTDIKTAPMDLSADEARAYARDIRKSLTALRNLTRILDEHKEQSA